MFLFFSDPAPTEIYPLSLHDALPISPDALDQGRIIDGAVLPGCHWRCTPSRGGRDRKSTRLNSSHQINSYAVFWLKKKKNNKKNRTEPGTKAGIHTYDHEFKETTCQD